MPFGIGVFLGIIIGSYIFHSTKSELISIAIGFTIIIFALINYYGFKIKEKLISNKIFGFFFGVFSGVIGGMTTVLGPLMIIYLVSLNLSKKVCRTRRPKVTNTSFQPKPSELVQHGAETKKIMSEHTYIHIM